MNDARASAPLRLADAERVNPYQLLLDLYDHALGRSTASDKEEVLAESHRPRVGTGRSLTAATDHRPPFIGRLHRVQKRPARHPESTPAGLRTSR